MGRNTGGLRKLHTLASCLAACGGETRATVNLANFASLVSASGPPKGTVDRPHKGNTGSGIIFPETEAEAPSAENQ